jgi:hypothetical protein
VYAARQNQPISRQRYNHSPKFEKKDITDWDVQMPDLHRLKIGRDNNRIQGYAGHKSPPYPESPEKRELG